MRSVIDRKVVMRRMTVQICCVCVCVSKVTLLYMLYDIYQLPLPVILFLTLM